MERLTMHTPTGAALKLNSPNTEQEAREQLMLFYKIAVNKLAAYEDAEEQGRLVILPDIKRNRTLYWIWAGEIMPVTYRGISHGNVRDGKFYVYCNMKTKKPRTFRGKYGKKIVDTVIPSGNKRVFSHDDIGKTIFLTREEAERALAEMEARHD